MIRSVLFIDPPGFCTTVEGLVAPALRERPVIVAAPGADRATVLALSVEARRAGITRGMPVNRARKLCPDLIVRPPNPRLYARASRALDEILRRYAPVIEPKGYGHAFLDLTGTGRLFGPAVDVAMKIQREARDRLHLPLAAGVAQNKLVSHAAAEVVKTAGNGEQGTGNGGYGDGLIDVEVGSEARFLAPEEVELLPDLDPKMLTRLDEYQLERIGEIQAISDNALAAVFGQPGRVLGMHARGIDPRPVLPPAVRAEFRAAHTLGNDSNDLALLHRVLRHLTERLGSRLRARHLVARRLTVYLAYTDYATAKRSVPLALAALDMELWETARRAFGLANQRTVALRAIGVSVDRFLEADLQLELWGEVPSTEYRVPSAKCLTLSARGSAATEGSLEVRAGPQGIPRSARDDNPSFVLGTRYSVLGTEHRSQPRDTALQSALDRIRMRWGTRGVKAGG
jgi:DNA polymerase-4